MKLMSATLITAASAAAAMLWMNKDRFLNRSLRNGGTGRRGTAGGVAPNPAFPKAETPAAPSTPAH